MHNLNRPRSWYGGCRTHIRGPNIEQIRWLNYLALMLRLGQSHFMMRIDEMVREGQEQGPKHNRSISLDKNSYVLDIRLRRDYWALSRRRGLENSTSAIIRPCCRLAAARAWFATCEKWKVPLPGIWQKLSSSEWAGANKGAPACAWRQPLPDQLCAWLQLPEGQEQEGVGQRQLRRVNIRKTLFKEMVGAAFEGDKSFQTKQIMILPKARAGRSAARKSLMVTKTLKAREDMKQGCLLFQSLRPRSPWWRGVAAINCARKAVLGQLLLGDWSHHRHLHCADSHTED